jgi:hypothetical protein
VRIAVRVPDHRTVRFQAPERATTCEEVTG